ncbi:MAG: DUF4340 domain-containing protein [Proteobacteria bacterium]|nr:DUF4340 domain-containing protein [Pseudomonadota bacterium]
MQQKNLLNLILLIVAISLASVIYFSEKKNTDLEKLSTINTDEITSIIIQHKQNTTSILRQKNNSWQIERPVTIAANDFRINSILKLINAPVHSKYSIDETDLTSLGLNKPGTSIKFNDQTIAFGIINPATNLRYIRLDKTVYTIEDVYYPLLSSNFGTLVSLNLLPKTERIEKLILINQTISRNEKGFLKSNIDISADTINKTIDHWLHDQAFAVHEYMTREALGEVFIYLEGQQQPINYLITDTDPWLILARPEIGLEYHLDIEAYNNLIVPQ